MEVVIFYLNSVIQWFMPPQSWKKTVTMGPRMTNCTLGLGIFCGASCSSSVTSELGARDCGSGVGIRTLFPDGWVKRYLKDIQDRFKVKFLTWSRICVTFTTCRGRDKSRSSNGYWSDLVGTLYILRGVRKYSSQCNGHRRETPLRAET